MKRVQYTLLQVCSSLTILFRLLPMMAGLTLVAGCGTFGSNGASTRPWDRQLDWEVRNKNWIQVDDADRFGSIPAFQYP